MKECSKCKSSQNGFYKNNKTKDGLDNLCKVCRKGYNKKNYKYVSTGNKQGPKPKYNQKPCVYKITLPDGRWYWGSTCQNLGKRLSHHKSENRSSLGKVWNNLELSRFDFTIEFWERETEEEVRLEELARIKEDFEKTDCLNKNIPIG